MTRTGPHLQYHNIKTNYKSERQQNMNTAYTQKSRKKRKKTRDYRTSTDVKVQKSK